MPTRPKSQRPSQKASLASYASPKERRLAMNRATASARRRRQKELIDELQKSCEEIKARNRAMRIANESMEASLAAAKAAMAAIEAAREKQLQQHRPAPSSSSLPAATTPPMAKMALLEKAIPFQTEEKDHHRRLPSSLPAAPAPHHGLIAAAALSTNYSTTHGNSDIARGSDCNSSGSSSSPIEALLVKQAMERERLRMSLLERALSPTGGTAAATTTTTTTAAGSTASIDEHLPSPLVQRTLQGAIRSASFGCRSSSSLLTPCSSSSLLLQQQQQQHHHRSSLLPPPAVSTPISLAGAALLSQIPRVAAARLSSLPTGGGGALGGGAARSHNISPLLGVAGQW